MAKKKDDDTKPKMFTHLDEPGEGRKLVIHMYDTEIPLCRRLMKRVGLTEALLVKFAEFMRECIVADGPKKENRFLQAGGKVAGVAITDFRFRIIGSVPKKADVALWTDMDTPKKKSTTRRKKQKAK